MTIAALLAEITNFLARKDVDLTESTFGRLAVNDGKFVGRLRAGGDLRLATAEKARAFIANYPVQNRTEDSLPAAVRHGEPRKRVLPAARRREARPS